MVKLVELFFEFCESHHLILSRKKAIIMRKNLRTLGFVVSKEGKHLDPTRIISLLEMAMPRSKETLHSMLSSFTFVRMFIPNFGLIAAPLYEATKGIIWKGPQSGKAKGIQVSRSGIHMDRRNETSVRPTSICAPGSPYFSDSRLEFTVVFVGRCKHARGRMGFMATHHNIRWG